jgi:2-C-methyl-D-erythritol 2,4-cyclodiphosphate synthase
MIKTGIGYDVHQLVKGESLVIGSVPIQSEFGSLGHSDGDALIHSICDAILGAASLGDLGTYFPSNNKKWKNVESKVFLIDVISRIKKGGYLINHIDATIVIQTPMLNVYIPEIKKTLATILELDKSQVSIKATTTDNLGFIGKGLGWSVLAIATLSG